MTHRGEHERLSSEMIKGTRCILVKVAKRPRGHFASPFRAPRGAGKTRTTDSRRAVICVGS